MLRFTAAPTEAMLGGFLVREAKTGQEKAGKS